MSPEIFISLIVFGILGIACSFRLVDWLITFSEEKAATTPEHRERIVHKRLEEAYRKDGHKDPRQAARDHTSMLTHVEFFRRFACDLYVASGLPLDDIKEAWLDGNLKSVREAVEIAQGKPQAVEYVRKLKETILTTPADDVFLYGEASRKWHKEKAKRRSESQRLIAEQKRCEVADHVICSLWHNRGDAKRLMG